MCIFCTLPLNIVCKLALKGYYINKKQTEGKKKKVDIKNLSFFLHFEKNLIIDLFTRRETKIPKFDFSDSS